VYLVVAPNSVTLLPEVQLNAPILPSVVFVGLGTLVRTVVVSVHYIATSIVNSNYISHFITPN